MDGKGWSGTEKSRTAKTIGITDSGLIKEKNHGSETILKDGLVSGVKSVGPMASGEDGFKTSLVSLIRGDQYNLHDFQQIWSCIILCY